jgi:hypothetical protein
MPLNFVGHVLVESIEEQERVGSSSFTFAVVFECGMDWSLGATVKLWVNEEAKVFPPEVGQMYDLHAKVTTNDENVVEMEATRFFPLKTASKALEGYLYGVALFDGLSSEGNCALLAHVYANGKKGELKMNCKYSATQYKNFMNVVKKGQEVFFHGELDDIDAPNEVKMKCCHFSFQGGKKGNGMALSLSADENVETSDYQKLFTSNKKLLKMETPESSPKRVLDFEEAEENNGKRARTPIKKGKGKKRIISEDIVDSGIDSNTTSEQ